MSTVLQVDSLSKYYGALKAVDNISFSIQKGQVYGILGPNGSGKTSTLGVLLGVLKKASGDFNWFGNQLDTPTKRRIGSMLETPNFYPYLSAKKNLLISSYIKNSSKSKIDEVLDFVGLTNYKSLNFKQFSLGMKQRLAIANALLNDPEVLILDEPTNGLDPSGIIEIRELINRLSEDGKTILLASHLLDEVQKVCTHTLIMKKGKIIYDGPIETNSNEIEVSSNNIDLLENTLKDIPHIKILEQKDTNLIIESSNLKTDEINKLLHEKGISLNRLIKRKVGLEKIFLEITGLKK
ncbi:ABC transporter ATP-binding protein [Candidatus Kapabacteria bacterium]|nr:ABC transporter ATP-binding protein [Candidatus Kapabacteria bacterium]